MKPVANRMVGVARCGSSGTESRSGGIPSLRSRAGLQPGTALSGEEAKASFPRLRRGFTLIEVLVSLAIFALAAVVLSVAYLNILGSYRTLGTEQQLEEHWKLLRTVVLSEGEKLKVEEGGRVGLSDGRTLNWKAVIEPTDIADLFRLTLEADAPGGNGTEEWKRTQTIYLLRPNWSEPGERDRLREQTRQRMAREERL